ncbi:cell cycle checkpoint control protein RAD9B isoform X2 [Anabas testudineus]|uniref:cell cycle checkpoint control protein RAD9B isoform X2 n=1 Tax=Anabas testudineus TaxID=64144 RepID=UPI000E455F69|nr:cell cycle checkpoint control protein RAD9B isoform X2 [Anabas testudineus]
MNCVFEGNAVKAFGKAVQALSRIGEELWLDPMVKGLALRSVNAAHSAYACFHFSPLFFQHYSLGSGPDHSNEAIKCKLAMKSVLPLFRCLTSIERNVERCQIWISTPSDRVVIQFFCRHGITKTHNLHFQESEALQAVFASHLCPNVLKASARLLGDMVMHFPVSQEEITLSMTPLKVSLRNYYEREHDHLKIMYTEMSLHPDEFDYFQVGANSDITFCLKELRGFLSFAESHCLSVSIHFSAAGKSSKSSTLLTPDNINIHQTFQMSIITDVLCRPVCFSVEDMVLEATVVLATLVDSESRGPSQLTRTPASTTARCADAAALCVGPYEADCSTAHDAPAVMELIASSQGSPIIDSPTLTQFLPQIYNPGGLTAPDDACDGVNTTPSSTTVCSLLFKALSSEQDDDFCAARLPVLACYSDTEEDEEDPKGSPSL